VKIALFGFPLTGKTTLFELLTGVVARSHAAPGDALAGTSRVPDSRLDRLVEMYEPRRVTPATVEYLDLVGVEKGQASKVMPLDQLRTADALAHVVRAFEDESIPHTEGAIDPARDVDLLETEFILADHTVAERRIEKLELLVRKTNRDEDRRELALFRRALAVLERETPLRNEAFTENELRMLRGYTFLSLKPLLVVVNAGENEASRLDGGPAAFGLEAIASRPRTEVVALSAKIEAEIAELDSEHRNEFMEHLGIAEPALDRSIRASYRLLGAISFFTVGEDECRAWTIRHGTPARRAAGTIHSDIERGFIRAELVAYDDLRAAGVWNACRERGTLRLEGKEYVVRDGDVINFRFNV
jgi:GTP-binding protein YchF